MARKKLPPREYAWSANLAYAIGLLVTDGNLSSNGRSVVLRSIDEEMVLHFKYCLGAHQHIRKTEEHLHRSGNRKPVYQIQIGDVMLYRWLLTIGLTPRKTLTVGAITIPDNYFRDFLRGHLDGDGTITTYSDRYNAQKHPLYIYTRIFARFISASEKHILWLRATLFRLTELHGDLSCQTMKSGNTMWQLKFMKKESLKLFDWIYYAPDIPCLARKREKAEQAIALVATQTRKPYTRTGKFVRAPL